jgi:hypothetical protein
LGAVVDDGVQVGVGESEVFADEGARDQSLACFAA